ncbi:MAG: hypothetical protein KJ946_07605 [Gammaproteobacteria bacterium]|nr:hypothetical protein [Gammaproteobacteria bacterium]
MFAFDEMAEVREIDMSASAKPKRTLIAYCVLADRLRTPGVGAIQALIPFLAEACQQFAGELFDAGKFSNAVAERYGIRIPRLAALGLAEQLEREGVLTLASGHGASAIYRYVPILVSPTMSSAVTEAEVEVVLKSFVDYCEADDRLQGREDSFLQEAFLERLLNVDSMRILGRREGSISAKKNVGTVILSRSSSEQDPLNSEELHLDFLVSQFLLDLRDRNPVAFEQVSNVAFANMAAEAIACFREPPSLGISLDTLTVYLDTPLLLDMLGVNTEYADYGHELLQAIRVSGAKAAVFEHCVAEAEAAVYAQLNYLRSGVNKFSIGWGTTATPDLLAALIGNLGERTQDRLGIEVHRDSETNLLRRSQTTVGDVEAKMQRRMQAWRNDEAKDYDRQSVWSMLAIRDTSDLVTRVCDSRWLLLTRNTPLVGIANDAWRTWLNGTTKHSRLNIERWAPVAMSDKQFAGYLWARTGGTDGAISQARLLAHCSSAVRPRADIKAKAYNLMLELSGRRDAEDLAALLEDREGVKALMRATRGDPEDVTLERLPFIVETVKLAAGEFAAARAREESEKQLEENRRTHEFEVARLRKEAEAERAEFARQVETAKAEGLQQQQDKLNLESQNSALNEALAAKAQQEGERRNRILKDGFEAGRSVYRWGRWVIAATFGAAVYSVSVIAAMDPLAAAPLSGMLGFIGFWFVPNVLNRPLNWCAMRRLCSVVASRDSSIEIPSQIPDFSAKLESNGLGSNLFPASARDKL